VWLLLALIAYSIFAVITIVDKFLLEKPIPNPFVYSFYTGVLGIFTLVLVPFGFEIPTTAALLIGLIAGIVFIGALLLFFSALQIGEASRIGISFGGFVPFFTLTFIYFTTKEFPNVIQGIALLFLVAGGFVIVLERIQTMIHNFKKFLFVVSSSILFGLYFTMTRFLFEFYSFATVYIIINAGSLLFALSFLLFPRIRRQIFQNRGAMKTKFGGLFVLKNASGGLASLLIHKAVALAYFSEVAIINALQGFQFALVFFLALFMTKKYPHILHEEFHKRAIISKIIGMGLIIIGIAILAF
jgi:drug/metabolite transporter (DMT)-like permease